MTTTADRPSPPAPDAPDVPPKPAWFTRPYVQAIGVYLLVRLCGVVVLSLLADQHGESLSDLLKSWDGDWYLSIAQNGYSPDGYAPRRLVDLHGNYLPTVPLAFFPAYPTLVRVVAMLPGLDLLAAALLINVAAGVIAACAIFRIGRSVGGRDRVGLLLVALWSGAPMAITLSMAYTEALFTALAAWSLVGVMERRWLLAGLCCAGAGLVRSSVTVLIVVVGVAALVAFLRDRRNWIAAVGAVICPVGLAVFWGYVASRTGSLTGWMDIEREGWGFEFDAGKETLEFIGEMLTSGRSVMETMNVFIVLGAVVLAVLGAVGRIPWPLVAYAAGMVVLVAGSSGIPFAKARFLIPAFTLLIPVALGLANRRRGTMIAATTGIVLLGSWFSAYALTGWQYAI